MSTKRNRAASGGGGRGDGAGGGSRGRGGTRKVVRFQKKGDSEEEESDDARPQARRRVASRGKAMGDGSDEEDEEDLSRRRGVVGGGGGGGGGGGTGIGGDDDDDDDEEDERGVNRMVEEVHGEEEEDEHYERTNEAGDPIEPFNLRNERDIGYFDTNGNFVWKKEEEERDPWLAEMDEGAMEEAIGAATNRATKSQVHEKAGAGAAGGGGALGVATAMDSVSLMSMADMRDEVITLLLPEETVVQALRRLGARPRESRPGEKKSGIAGRKRRKKERDKDNAIPDENGTENDAGKVPENGSGNRTTAVAHGQRSGENATGHGNSDQEKKEGSSDDAAGRTDSTSIEDSEEKKRQEEFGRLTDLADGLLQAGQHDVYQQTKEELEEGAAAAAEAEAARSSAVASYFGGLTNQQLQHQQQYHEHQQQQDDTNASAEADAVYYEYKGKDGNVHGPYGASQMRQWVQQGYFDGEQAVMMRRVDREKVQGKACGDADSGETKKDTSADLMADLDDDDEEEEEGGGGSKSDRRASSEEWVLSDSIDWSAF